MSKLSRAEIPVKWFKISDICKNVSSGGTPKSGNKEYYGGNIPWLRTQDINWIDIYDTSKKITEEGLDNSSANWIPPNCVIVAMYGATAAKVAINKIPLTTNQACCNLEIDENIALYRYVFHWLSKEYHNLKAMGQGSQANINAQIIKQYPIPVPPREVQQEIIRILDSFTELTAELTTELTAELTARKQQFEYYRDKLLTFDTQVQRLKISEICKNVSSGGTPKSGNKEYYGGSIPWLRTQDINWIDIYDTSQKITEAGLEKSSANWIPPNCVIVAMYGATAAKVAINKIPLTTNQACCNLEIDENIASYRYVFHWLSKEYHNLKAMGQGSQANINAQIIKEYPIPVPSLTIQRKIVSSLDHFDVLCNNLSDGLPAEIEARQKQYEYYRDKLLTFKEKMA